MAIQNINLGTLSETPTPVEHHSVNSSEPYDTYRFRLDSPGNINLSLTGTSADADVVLYRDVNNNGVIDEGVDTWIQNSTFGLNNAHDEAINIVAEADDYIAKVYSYNNNSTDYDLRLSTTPSHSTTPSNLLPVEFRVDGGAGFLSRDLPPFPGHIDDSNTVDVYAFQLTHGTGGSFQESVDITLSGLSQDSDGEVDVDIRLIRDFNGNRIVDEGDEIIRSADVGIANEHLSVNDNNPYFLQVYQYSGNTDYTLTFDHNFATV